jgi:hypothetical protein
MVIDTLSGTRNSALRLVSFGSLFSLALLREQNFKNLLPLRSLLVRCRSFGV